MTLPDYGSGESLCGENKCRKLLNDMEGATCLDCGASPTYCADHIVTNACGSTQCFPCHENQSCGCRICKRSDKDDAAEARWEAARDNR